MNGTADAFHFVYQTLTGDGELTARVATLQNTNAAAKAAVMIRQSTVAGSIDSYIAVTPTTFLKFYYRAALNGGTTLVQASTSGAAPYYIKIVKDGTLVTGYLSPDGVTWTYGSQVRLASLANPVQIGFAVCSHNTGALCTATFDNIALTPKTTFSPPSPWHDQDIGTTGQLGQIHLEQYLWSLYAAGGGVTGTADSFHFGYQSVSGNVVAIAQVNGFNSTAGAAGVLVRQDLTAASAEAGVTLGANGGINFVVRSSLGASLTSVAGASVSAPYWVKIVRLGSVFSGYQSSDGNTWTLVGSQSVTMTGPIYAGVEGASGNTTSLSLAVLDRVYILPNDYLASGLVSSGAYHNLYLQPNGNVWAWGLNANGQLGDATSINRLSPVLILNNGNIQSVSAGAYHSLALRNDGTVLAWGLNTYGQLGDGTTGPESTPESLGSLSGIVAVSAGASHSLALKYDGTVYSWGSNSSGQLGLGSGSLSGTNTPQHLSTLSGIVAISAGGVHSMALRGDGTVWVWGGNATGQLGDNNSPTQENSPEQLSLVNMAAVSAGFSHSLALADDGTVWAWGDNSCGEVGDGSIPPNQKNIPVHLGTLTGMIAIQASNLFSLALRNDGTVWAWGTNTNGQLGNNTTTQENSPVQTLSLTNVVSLGGGYAHSVSANGNSSLTAWGNNADGQLGNGTMTSSQVAQTLSPEITGAGVATGFVGAPFSYSITATSNPTAYNATGLPGGLTVNSTSGVISGTPATAGGSIIALSAANLSGTGTGTLNLTVNPAPPAPVVTSSTAGGTVGVGFTYAITASNSPTSFGATGLPSGLTINTATGLISGTATSPGYSLVTITATNYSGTGTGTINLTVNNVSAWTGVDIGSVVLTGSNSYDNTSGIYSITGAGADINGTVDAFHYVYQTLGGDGSLTARVKSVQNTNTTAKAAVMIRQSNAAGDSDSYIAETPGGGIKYYYRSTLNGSTTSPLQVNSATAPYWLRIVKSGTTISTYTSSDGVSWGSPAAQTTLSSLTNPVEIGLAVCSHNTSALCTATFDNVALVGGGAPSQGGLALWLKANAGLSVTNNLVTSWTDQASSMTISQSNTNSQPIYEGNVYNGFPALRFDGSRTLASSGNYGSRLNAGMTIVVVGMTTNPSSTEFALYLGQNNTVGANRAFLYQSNLQDFDGQYAGSNGGPAPVASALNVETYMVSSSLSNMFFYRDGMNLTPGSNTVGPNPLIALSSNISVGSITGIDPWYGDIAEILVYDHQLSTAEFNQIDGSLADKYGLYDQNATWPLFYSSAVQAEIIRHQWDKAHADSYVAFQANNASMLTNGLTAWYRADSGVTVAAGQVTNWFDQTGNYSLSQTTTSSQPTFVSSDVNGLPALHFNGSQLLSNSSTPSGMNADMTMITVTSTTDTDGGTHEISLWLGSGTTTGANRSLGYNGGTEFYDVYLGGLGSGAPLSSPNTFVIDEGTISSTNMSTLNHIDQFRNGVGTISGSPSATPLNLTSGMYVGAYPSPNFFWNGDIAEILIYDHQLASGELQQVNNYLMNKYNILAPVPPTISPAGGSYSTTQTVTISGQGSNPIHYTLDGSEPNIISPTYVSPFSISASATVKAAQFNNGLVASPVASAQFYINDSLQTGLPTPPTTVSAVAVSSTEIDLTWTLGGTMDYSSLDVLRSANSGNYFLIAALDPTATSYADLNVLAGTNYVYEVAAWNSFGLTNSLASSSISPPSLSNVTVTVTTPSGATPLP